MDFSSILLATTANAAAPAQGGGMSVMLIVMLVFMIVYMFVISRKEKKQQQAEKDMRDNLSVGDEILTIGGIMGRVVTVKEDSIVIESGADRNKIRFTKQAIAKNMTAAAKAEEIRNAQVAEAQKKMEEKKAQKAKKSKKD